MRQSRLASYEMLQDVLKATNRYVYACPGAVYMGEADIRHTFPEPTEGDDFDMLDEVEQLLELIDDGDNQLEVKWGYDDERAFPPSLPNPEDAQVIHESFESHGWRVTRSDKAVYVWPQGEGASAGPVIFWFTSLVDTSFPQPNGYVNQD